MMRAIDINNTFQNIYNKIKFSTVKDEYQVDWLEFTVGVRQGCVCQQYLSYFLNL